MIEVRKLVKRFGLKTVLRGLDFHVEPGEFVAILGPNGAGKTTFLRILSSLSRPSLGDVRIAGYQLPAEASHLRRRLGVVSHLPLLYGDLTAEENLRFYGRMYSVPDLNQRISQVLELVGLATRRRDLVRTFSRGMVQRLAIARALLHDPAILLLDEPDTGLDPQAAEMLHRLLAELSGRVLKGNSPPGPQAGNGSDGAANLGRARTIVTITHNLERGLAIADRIAILAGGRLVYEADVRDLSAADARPLYDRYVGGGG